MHLLQRPPRKPEADRVRMIADALLTEAAVLRDAAALAATVRELSPELEAAAEEAATMTRSALEDGHETTHAYAAIDFDDEEQVIASAYLGTVFALAPSGKYYTFWANSNLELCPLCDGWTEEARPPARLYHLRRLVYRATEAARRPFVRLSQRCYPPGSPGARPLLWRINSAWYEAARDHLRPAKICLVCDGHGSQDVALDTMFWEATEEAIDDLPVWIASGEGDPCDVYLMTAAEFLGPAEAATPALDGLEAAR